MSPPPAIRPLDATTRARTLRAIDALLTRSRPLLVGADEQLEGALERALDAEADRGRILLYSRVSGRTVAFADASLHAPGPGDLTIAQLVVRRSMRAQGLGRALVGATLARAEARLGQPVDGLYAAVLPGNTGALAFWESLGLVVVDRSRVSIVLRGPPALAAARGARSES